MNKLILSILSLALFPAASFSQGGVPNGWNDPFPPHKVMDNLYYVGTKELATFLIVTPQGNILMNSNYEASVPVIRAGVEKLGFIKILIAGHAHPDHVEADAMVKSLTGAQVVVGRLEEAATRAFRPGGKEGSRRVFLANENRFLMVRHVSLSMVLPHGNQECLYA